jgi:hypothetical protein
LHAESSRTSGTVYPPHSAAGGSRAGDGSRTLPRSLGDDGCNVARRRRVRHPHAAQRFDHGL